MATPSAIVIPEDLKQALEQSASLTSDSRDDLAGAIFLARRGAHYNPFDHVDELIARGCVGLIVGEDAPHDLRLSVPVWRFESLTEIIPWLGKLKYPRVPQTILGVTGTNGKTSTATFVQKLLNALGEKSVAMGTLGVSYGDVIQLELPNTTLEALPLRRLIDSLSGEGVLNLALECSSIGVATHRLDGIEFIAIGFTNLTQDHLDFHHSMENYKEAKFKLFSEIAPQAACVLNLGNPTGVEFYRRLSGHKILTYGVNTPADLEATDLKTENGIQTFQLRFKGETLLIKFPMAGQFMVENLLCALGLILATTSFALQEIAPHIADLHAPRGRFETVPNQKGVTVIIDYAHTDDALEKLLETARPLVQGEGKLRLVFGCGGDRDASKRPLMGAVAHLLADDVIITDDNPRTENAAAIRQAIVGACPNAHLIADRAQAIRQAILNAATGDVVVIAGKGHETTQIMGDQTLHFDDREEALKALSLSAA